MAGGARRGANKTVAFIESAVFAVGSIITLGELDITKPHCFAGVQFFSDAAGTIPVVPSAGTVLIEIQTVNTAPVFEPPLNNLITASAPSTVTWAANTQSVRATPAGVTGTVYYKLVVTCNET
jgi:hypothetical protein